jgi:murein DD-endopeptidase MepM/ murein hydrolase activator NlpD
MMQRMLVGALGLVITLLGVSLFFPRGVIAQTASVEACKAAILHCPVFGGCTVTSTFRRNRKSPVDGVVRNHNGTDYRAAERTLVFAAASGTVERSYHSTTFGETIILRHTDGAATLYAHLYYRGVEKGTFVRIGTIIGEADSTGRSKASHLHFEYVPSGEIIESSGRIDPAACIGDKTVTFRFHTIRNGEAFSVSRDYYVTWDGAVIARNSTGTTNEVTYSNTIRNAIAGPHKLAFTLHSFQGDVESFDLTASTQCMFFKDGAGTEKASLTVSITGAPIVNNASQPIENGNTKYVDFVIREPDGMGGCK